MGVVGVRGEVYFQQAATVRNGHCQRKGLEMAKGRWDERRGSGKGYTHYLGAC